MVPNVECAMGKPVAVQWAAMLGFEKALSDRFRQLGAAGFASADERAEWSAKMLLLSGGRNGIKWVDDGDTTAKYFPSIVVRRTAGSQVDYLSGGSDDIAPAFVVGSTNMAQYWAGKYPGPYVTSNSKTIMLSLCWFDGMANAITGAFVLPNYDQAVTYGLAGGNGSHCMTNAEWMEIALSCLRDGYQPKGNNNYGINYQDSGLDKRGVPCYWDSDKTARVLNGSGPLSWFHDGTPWGVWGMGGNFYQRTPGFRQSAGEIQVIANNDAALSATDQSATSTEWQAMLADGSLVAPGTADTLKYDATDPPAIVTTITTHTVDSGAVIDPFGNVTGDAPVLAKLLGIAPAGTASELGNDYIYLRNPETGSYAETLALRSGSWSSGSQRGVFALYLGDTRPHAYNCFGARPAFVDPEYL